ncbi:hypothetical protein SEUCBS140593_009235 [Sporothrix eucalyptigena]|uniref:Major facilitator superfamily (MFS) profile domain-containing protein n=1 Tax=Sporothrix eucalyptigena TaxID=1812306 RepID=A0ABP0CUP1_9PEZI
MAALRDIQARAEKSLVDQTNLLAAPKLVAVFAALSFALLTSLLDQNGVSTALPTIAADLDAQDTISWAGTSSLIANTTFQMLYGRLSDIFGRKGVFLGAIFLLVLADIACSRAQSAAVFYVFRGVAGVATGGVTNVAMIIVSDVVTLEQRGTYQGILGAMVGVANVVGPFLAAVCVERLMWRAFFYVLAPLAAVVFVLSCFLVPTTPTAEGTNTKQRLVAGAKNIDIFGTLTSSAAVIFLLIPISGGGAYYAWSSPMVITMLVLGVMFMALFIIVEMKVARLPMMPITLFRNPVIVVMLVQNFLFGAVYQSSLYYVPLYLQNAHQYSAVVSAAITASLVAMQTLFSILSGLYISWRKRYIETSFNAWASRAKRVFIAVWAMHQDEKLYDHIKYNLDRFLNYPKLAREYAQSSDYNGRDNFGYGADRHICPGVHLAKRNMWRITAKLLLAFNLDEAKDPVPGKVIPLDENAYNSCILVSPLPFRLRVESCSKAVLEKVKREKVKTLAFMS